MTKINDYLLCTYLFLISLSVKVLATCLEASHLTPCTCEDEYGQGKVTCTDLTGDKFKAFFTNLEKLEHGDRHIHHVVLTGAGCDQLVEHTFQDITVDIFEIRDAPNFTTIHSNAFVDINKLLSHLFLVDLPALEVTNLFDVINKFRRLESLIMINLGKLQQIPSEAFKVMRKLESLAIQGKNLKKISEKAFWNLNALSTLHITDTSIDAIGENVLSFSKHSDHFLTISLYSNPKLTCSGLAANAFTRIDRPTTLDFSGHHYVDEHYRKQMTCLPEKVFKPFLEKDDANDIELYEIDFDCKNCSNAWIKKLPDESIDRLMNIKCEGGKHINDKDVFAHCK